MFSPSRLIHLTNVYCVSTMCQIYNFNYPWILLRCFIIWSHFSHSHGILMPQLILWDSVICIFLHKLKPFLHLITLMSACFNFLKRLRVICRRTCSSAPRFPALPRRYSAVVLRRWNEVAFTKMSSSMWNNGDFILFFYFFNSGDFKRGWFHDDIWKLKIIII